LRAKILCTDEVKFTRDGVVNFHNTHAWVDDKPHTTVASRQQHWIPVDVPVGTLGDQLLGSVVHNRCCVPSSF
jgi:hypothetical protein